MTLRAWRSTAAARQIGATADIKVRPSGDPDGVGITISFVLPNSLDGAPISLTEINSTFDGLRYPATCPATPANVSVAVNSDSDPTLQTVTAPLAVTGCASLPYAPKFAVSATQDTAIRQVKLATDITQAADESPSQSVALGVPDAVLAPNVSAAAGLCADPAAGKCTPVGSATAASPLYPAPLSGKAYLTGSLAAGLSLTLVFPSPFPLTLTGKVNLATNTTAFTGLPDIPLTDLNVTLDGGHPTDCFMSTCKNPSGTATATLERSERGPHRDPVRRRSPSPTASAAAGTGAGDSAPRGATASPRLSKAGGVGSAHRPRRPRLHGHRGQGRGQAARLTVRLPAGMSFRRHRVGKKLTVAGVALTGAKIKSLTLSHGHLVIALRTPVSDRRGQAQAAGAVSESAEPEGQGQGQEAQEPAVDRDRRKRQGQAHHDQRADHETRAVERRGRLRCGTECDGGADGRGRHREHWRRWHAGGGVGIDRDAGAHAHAQLGHRGRHGQPRSRHHLQPAQPAIRSRT